MYVYMITDTIVKKLIHVQFYGRGERFKWKTIKNRLV